MINQFLQCGSCDYRITDNGQYQKHISEEHGGSVGTRCLECGDSFSNKFVLLEHMQREHDKFKRDNVLSRYTERIVFVLINLTTLKPMMNGKLI